MCRNRWLLIALAAPLVGCSFDYDGIEGEHHQFVLDTFELPDGEDQAQALAFDVDGDGDLENEFGVSLAGLFGIDSFIQNRIRDAIARGELIILADLQTVSLTNAGRVGITIYIGADPSVAPCAGESDATCGDHLRGDASFAIAPESRSAGVLVGSIRDGRLTAGPGTIAIRVPVAPGLPSIPLDIVGAFVEADVSESGVTNARLGGGISNTQLLSDVFPGIAASVTAIVSGDCTGSPPLCCTPLSIGTAVMAALDGNRDCTIQESEFNSFIMSVFQIDVDLFDGTGSYNPRTDEVQDSISAAAAFTGVGASFELP